LTMAKKRGAPSFGGVTDRGGRPVWQLVVGTLVAMALVAAGITAATAPVSKGSAELKPMDEATRERYREAAKEMFYHSYDSYLLHAFPKDELRPIACKGHDTHNCHGCLLTFYDALDTLVVLGNRTEFARVVKWLSIHGAAAFDRDQTVSVFETNIRVLGSLISNHMLAKREDLELMSDYNDELLTLALDLGNRLLRAYMTPTGLPWGSISLKTGPKFGETPVTATATGGTVLLEFILLSQLSGEKKFARAAEKATKALWQRRSEIGLLGSHVNVETGEWVYFDSGIGGGIDSFYEYLMKAHLLTGKSSYLEMFEEGVNAISRHVRRSDGWYVDVDMRSGSVMFPYYRSLQSFWPGLLTLWGDLDEARPLFDKFYAIWRRYGFLPEAFNLASDEPQQGLGQYPLRPELAESAFFLHRSTGDDHFRWAGAAIIDSLNTHARVQCGYAAVENVSTKVLRDHMDSYFLAETVKYLYLLFDDSAWTQDFRDPAKYIFNTEAHLLPLPKPPADEFLLGPTKKPDYTRRRKRIDRNGKYKPKKKKEKKTTEAKSEM